MKSLTAPDVLAALQKRGGKATNRELAADLNVHSTKVALTLANMTRPGHVKRLNKGHRSIPSTWCLVAKEVVS